MYIILAWSKLCFAAPHDWKHLVLHKGQQACTTPCCCSHGAMQSLWNTCRQGSRMMCKPSSKESKQMLQLLSSSSAQLPASLACNPVSMLRPGMGRCGCNCS